MAGLAARGAGSGAGMRGGLRMRGWWCRASGFIRSGIFWWLKHMEKKVWCSEVGYLFGGGLMGLLPCVGADVGALNNSSVGCGSGC